MSNLFGKPSFAAFRVSTTPISWTSEDRKTALHLACFANNVDAVRHLLEAGATVDLADGHGRTALDLAYSKEYVEVVCLLLATGADEAWVRSNLSDDGSGTVLHWAAKKGRVDAVQSLLRMGVDKDLPDSRGRTALHIGSEAGNAGLVRCLLAAAASLDMADHRGMTALHYAAGRGHKEVACFLLQGRADMNLRDLHGKAALDWANTLLDASMVRLLSDHAGKAEP